MAKICSAGVFAPPPLDRVKTAENEMLPANVFPHPFSQGNGNQSHSDLKKDKCPDVLIPHSHRGVTVCREMNTINKFKTMELINKCQEY